MTVPVRHEEARVEREPITDANRDAAMSGPDITEAEHEVVLHEERPVVETETQPMERVRLTAEERTEQETVHGRVRKERIDTEGVDDSGPGTGGAMTVGDEARPVPVCSVTGFVPARPHSPGGTDPSAPTADVYDFGRRSWTGRIDVHGNGRHLPALGNGAMAAAAHARSQCFCPGLRTGGRQRPAGHYRAAAARSREHPARSLPP